MGELEGITHLTMVNGAELDIYDIGSANALQQGTYIFRGVTVLKVRVLRSCTIRDIYMLLRCYLGKFRHQLSGDKE